MYCLDANYVKGSLFKIKYNLVRGSEKLNNTNNQQHAELNANDTNNLTNELDATDIAIAKARSILEKLSRDPETVRLAELRAKQLRDEISMMDGAKEEGRAVEKREIAKRALIKGADISFIADITELSVDQIMNIRNKIFNK